MFGSFFYHNKESIQRKKAALLRQIKELEELEKNLDNNPPKNLFKDNQQSVISYSHQTFFDGKEKKSITRYNNNGKQVEVLDNQVDGKTIKHEETNNFNGDEKQVQQFLDNFKQRPIHEEFSLLGSNNLFSNNYLE